MKGDMKVVLRIPNECEALMSDAFEIHMWLRFRMPHMLQ